MPRKYRRYTEDDKAAALAFVDANKGNYKLAAKHTGIPWTTLQSWHKGIGVNEAVTKIHTEKRAELSDRMEEIAHLIADSIPNKIDEASLKDATFSLAIAVDKMRLLREQPTAINGDAVFTEQERTDRLTAILDAARERRDRQSAETDGKGEARQ